MRIQLLDSKANEILKTNRNFPVGTIIEVEKELGENLTHFHPESFKSLEVVPQKNKMLKKSLKFKSK